jgi:glycosyltransferase involved in cell wall biosynthesis
MKIVCVTDAFYPDHIGGVSKSILPEVEGLVKLGHQVTVISRLQTNKPRYEYKDGYEIYRYFSIKRKSILYRLYPLFSFTTLPYLISKLHHKHKFDIAYVHNPFQLAGIDLVLHNLPCVYVYHASVYSEISLDNTRGKYGKLESIAKAVNFWVKSLESKTLTTADRLIVRSNFMKDDMNTLYKNIDNRKVISLPLCVDTEKFPFAENNIAARHKLGLPQQRPILLTVRRLVARMGIENLIKAMVVVIQKYPDVLLLIGGVGYLEDDFHRMIQQYNLEENVQLKGYIPEEILTTYYQAANLFVLPTVAYEGFGLVTIESLACGTPVIATPVGASPEILNKLGKSFLFENTTSEAIAQGINNWLLQGFSSDIRKRCMNYCIDNFSQKRICHELEKAFFAISIK